MFKCRDSQIESMGSPVSHFWTQAMLNINKFISEEGLVYHWWRIRCCSDILAANSYQGRPNIGNSIPKKSKSNRAEIIWVSYCISKTFCVLMWSPGYPWPCKITVTAKDSRASLYLRQGWSLTQSHKTVITNDPFKYVT